MRLPRPSCRLASLTATALVLAGATLPARADDRIVYDSYPTEQPGFFHRVGDFFHDLFATQQSLGPRPTPPRPTAPRYNLDLPPPGTGYGFGRLAGQQDVNATEKSLTIAEHNGTTPPKPKPAKHYDSSSTSAKVEPHSTTTKTVTETHTEPAPKPKHSTPPEERPSSSSSKVAADDTPKTTSPSKVPAKVPTGTRTSKTTRVKSPYPPYNELDVTGLSPGSLAMDPTTQKVFRVP